MTAVLLTALLALAAAWAIHRSAQRDRRRLRGVSLGNVLEFQPRTKPGPNRKR